jgi:hypothetical protein
VDFSYKLHHTLDVLRNFLLITWRGTLQIKQTLDKMKQKADIKAEKTLSILTQIVLMELTLDKQQINL